MDRLISEGLICSTSSILPPVRRRNLEELKYYLVGIDNVFLNSKIELMMDIIEFSKLIRNNGIYNVFISEYSEKFTAKHGPIFEEGGNNP